MDVAVWRHRELAGPAGRREVRFWGFSGQGLAHKILHRRRGVIPGEADVILVLKSAQTVDADENHLVRPGLLELHEFHPRSDLARSQDRRPAHPHGFARQARGDARCVHREAGRQRIDAAQALGAGDQGRHHQALQGQVLGDQHRAHRFGRQQALQKAANPCRQVALFQIETIGVGHVLFLSRPGVTPPAPTGTGRAPGP